MYNFNCTSTACKMSLSPHTEPRMNNILIDWLPAYKTEHDQCREWEALFGEIIGLFISFPIRGQASPYSSKSNDSTILHKDRYQ